MKKTVNINLSGYGFTIDEDAYSMLKDYLETLRSVFQSNNYDDDLIDDLELRAAELLMENTPSGAIITTRDIENVIARLGRPEEMMEESEISETASTHSGCESSEERQSADSDGAANAENITPPPFEPKPRHRLYRDVDSKMLGGVCSGIAAYLNVDVVWIRLAFVLVTLASFSVAAVAYIVLWIIVPPAETPLQKMELRGETPTIDNIGRRVTDPGFTQPRAKATASTLWSIFLIGLAVVCIPILLGCGIAFIVCLILLVMVLTSGGLWFLEDVGLSGVWDSYPALGLTLCLLVLLVIIIPLVSFLISVFSSYNRPLKVSRGWRIAGAVIWVISLLGLGITSGKFYHDAERENTPARKITEKITNLEVNVKETTDSLGNTSGVHIDLSAPEK